ncbi:hypothetical protein SLEP1_g58348 [Rubroshorea leprosula]|uniref:Uncharacterized protein n=1 Tax=Rubroshorea leprosula TaxID=152421 RepID=A0AAV5MRG0_9ROSI|nr:hypothetical protein SLEP1_g58348 [Rubroshorea leprosula]
MKGVLSRTHGLEMHSWAGLSAHTSPSSNKTRMAIPYPVSGLGPNRKPRNWMQNHDIGAVGCSDLR